MIVIVGGTGKVGSKVADHLLNAGRKVRLIARHADKLSPFAARGAETMAGNITDIEFLTKAFTGADAVLIMMPMDFAAPDARAYQRQMGDSYIAAIKNSGVKNVVFISSVGAHTSEGNGIVGGLAEQEIKLNKIEGINVMNMRPTFFMENAFYNMGMIKSMGINGGATKGSVAAPMIATKDIAPIVADKLMNLNWKGKNVQPILGPRDYTFSEMTSILGSAIGKPDLGYMEFTPEQVNGALTQMGMTPSVADAMVGLQTGFNIGVMNQEKRDSTSTTPTTMEEFAKDFAAAYNAPAETN